MSELVERAYAAFRADAASPPPLTLRGGNAVDGYDRPQPFDEAIDEPTDAYLEGFAFWGLAYLDARSWRHYLPRLIEYSLHHPSDPAMVREALVRSLRPPDRYPPRLATLTDEQEAVAREFLESIALGSVDPDLQEEAQQALEEWWLPNPRARPTPDEIEALRAAPVTWRRVEADVYRLSVPDTMTGSGVSDIPSESRRAQTWGGYVCGDVHTVVAVNVTPLAVRSLRESVAWRGDLFLDPAAPAVISVPGSSRAQRLDGLTRGDSPAEPQTLTLVFAEAGAELVTLSIRTWDRDDVRRVVERIAGSLEITRGDATD